MVIYHNIKGTIIETLGNFNVSVTRVLPVLLEFVKSRTSDNRVFKISERQWLLFVAGRHTTVVTLFRNEPARQQIFDIERMHRDFENANRVSFERGELDPQKLAYPFLSFIQKKLGKS
jgi:hypothetical protein